MTAIDSKPEETPALDEGHDPDAPFQAHHFDTPLQQYESVKLGMWLFLGTEILFFGALFALYTILRANDPDLFSYASQYLNTILGGVNTAVLILSSLSMAAAVHFAQRGKKVLMLISLWLTLAGAAGFLGIKYFEYEHKIHVNLNWGPSFYYPVDGAEAAAVGEDGSAITVQEENARTTAEQSSLLGAERAQSLPDVPEPRLAPMPPTDAVSMAQSAIGPGGLSAVRPEEKIKAAGGACVTVA